tara:strand:- start:675 stop:2945 length:2271 start_codon:yes stop_codon:yes gene_type:complete
MNDPVLNRKMFRHQAQIIHNKIPKYQYGGPPQSPFTPTGFKQSLASRQAAAQAYFKNANKLKMLGSIFNPVGGPKRKLAVGALKQGWKGFQYTGIPRLVREAFGAKGTLTGKTATRIAKKYPKSYGAAKIGVGGSLTGAGVWTAGKGIYEGDPGKVATGVGEALWGPGIFLRGKKLWQHGKTPTKRGIAAFKKAAKRSRDYDKSKFASPWVTAPLILGGELTRKDYAEAAPEKIVLTETDREEIFNILKKTAKDIKKPTTEEIQNAYKVWSEQKTKLDNLGDKEKKVDNDIKNLEVDTTTVKSSTPVDGEEAQIMGKENALNAATQADVLKNKFNESDDATKREFLKFRQSITNLTGTYGNDRDLILMKLASGMMSGRSPHKGLKGFIDVTGQSMGPTVDTALALSNAQKGRDTDLANAFLKMKQEQAKEGNVGLKGDIKTFIVDDDNSPYKKKVVMAQYNDNGQLMQMNQDQQGNITYTPFTYINPEPIKKGANLGKLRTLLSSNAIGLDYIDYVLSLPDDVLGWRGYFNLLKSDYIGLSEGMRSRANKYTAGVDMGAYVEGTILNSSNLEQGNQGLRSPTNMFTSHAEWIQEEYKKDMKRARSIIEDEYEGKVSASQLDQLTQVALIETRLKYIVANANKSEDRLTRWDIENAAERTTLLGVLPRPFKEQPMTARGVRSQMRALKQQMSGQFDEVAQRYQFEGGTNNYILKYKHVPYVKQFLLEQGAKEQMMNAPNMQAILDTIKLNEGGIVGA